MKANDITVDLCSTCTKWGDYPGCEDKNVEFADVGTIFKCDNYNGPDVNVVDLRPTALILIEPENDLSAIALYNAGVKLRDYAVNRIIAGVEDMRDATKDLSIIAGVRKSLDAKKKEYIAPIKAHLDTFNAAFKDFMSPLLEADTINRDKMTAYDRLAEAERLKAEQLNRDALDVARRQAEASGTGEFTANIEPIPVPVEVPKTIHTDMGSAGKHDNWKWEVTDFALLDDFYKIPDKATITATVKKNHDTKPIPGLRIYNDPGYSVRPT